MNVEILTDLLTASPEDDIIAYLLTDALIEEREMVRSEANRVVLRARLAGYDARDLAQAAEAMRPDSAERSECMSVIRSACVHSLPVAFNVVLMPGTNAPHARCEYRSNPAAWWYEWTITVGASWILHAVLIRRAAEERRQTRATRRRRS